MRRRGLLLLLALMGALGVLFAGSPAYAEGEAIRGKVVGPVIDDTRSPVEGVAVTVSGSGGFTQTVTSDDTGSFEVPLPAPGDYTVELDTTTLPEGLSTPQPERTLTVGAGEQKAALFPLNEGEGPAEVASTPLWEQAAQLAADGLVLGLVLALGGVGLSLIYGTTGLTNFSHGELITLGGIAGYIFNNVLGVPFLLAMALAVLACGVLGGIQDKLLWARLRKRGTGLIAMLVVSIGFGIFLRYLILFFFGGQSQDFAEYAGQAGLQWGPISITPKALIGSIIAALLLVATAFWLLRTRIGKATRAVADNPALAAASGIDVERVINTVWVIGAALAAFGGILLGMNQRVSWQMGFQILLLIFAGVTVGGLGTAFGALVGCLLVGLVIQLSTLFVPTELKSVGALVILILVLLVRPQGILGRRERIG